MPEPQRGRSAHQAVLLTDRAIYRPGDTVHVKGYVRRLGRDGTELSLPKPTHHTVQVVWKRSDRGEGGTQEVQVHIYIYIYNVIYIYVIYIYIYNVILYYITILLCDVICYYIILLSLTLICYVCIHICICIHILLY